MKVIEITKTDVKNLNDTSDLKCKCDSWLDHWKKFSKKETTKCSEINCSKSADIGAHVIICNSSDEKHYIIPLCYQHNSLNDECFTISRASLVSANIKETCDI